MVGDWIFEMFPILIKKKNKKNIYMYTKCTSNDLLDETCFTNFTFLIQIDCN